MKNRLGLTVGLLALSLFTVALAMAALGGAVLLLSRSLMLAADAESASTAAGWLLVSLLVSGSALCLVAGILPWGRLKRRELGNPFPDLEDLIEEASKAMGVAPPSQIVVVGEANAFASYHNGVVGVLDNRTKVSLGMPLLYALSLRELEVVLAHELAHFRESASMRACAVSFEAEGFANSVTRGLEVRIRRRIVETQRVTGLRVAGLLYLACCTLPLKLLFDLLAASLEKLRNRLYVLLESEADHALTPRYRPEELKRVRDKVERLGSYLSQRGPGTYDTGLLKEAAKEVGASEPQGAERIAWDRLDPQAHSYFSESR